MSERGEPQQAGRKFGEVAGHTLHVAVFDFAQNAVISPTRGRPSLFQHTKPLNINGLPGEPNEDRARRIGQLLPDHRFGPMRVLGSISRTFDDHGLIWAHAVHGSVNAKRANVTAHDIEDVRKLIDGKSKDLDPTSLEYVHTRLLIACFKNFRELQRRA